MIMTEQRKPSVSVVIPCYEQARFLNRALDSLCQQGVDLEAIVVDDGSIEPVEITFSDYPFPIRLIRQHNSGPAKARNTGLRECSGKFVKFLDADDELLPCCLSSQLTSLGDDAETVSFIGFRLVYEGEGITQDILPAFSNFLQALLLTNLGPLSSYLFPTDLLLKTGGFHVGDRTTGGHEDYDLPLGLATSGINVVTVHKTGAVYYKREGSLSSRRVDMARSRVTVWTHHLPKALERADGNTLITALVAAWQLYRQTPEHSRGPLQQALPCLIGAVDRSGIQLPGEEVESLLTAMAEDNSTFTLELGAALRRSAARTASVNASGTNTHPLEIIDRRLTVPYAQWLIDRLPGILRQLRNIAPLPYAIYGAGELGRRLEQLLSAAGYPPEFFVDREAALMNESIHDIPVVTLQGAITSGLRHFVIASLHHRQSMVTELEKHLGANAVAIPTPGGVHV